MYYHHLSRGTSTARHRPPKFSAITGTVLHKTDKYLKFIFLNYLHLIHNLINCLFKLKFLTNSFTLKHIYYSHAFAGGSARVYKLSQ